MSAVPVLLGGRHQPHDAVGLTRYFIEGRQRADHDSTRVTSDTKFVIYDEAPYWQRELNPQPLKVAWLFHLLDADDLVTLEADAARLSFEDREQYLRHFAPRANPVVMSSFDVRSITGATVRFYAIVLPSSGSAIQSTKQSKWRASSVATSSPSASTRPS